MKQIFMSNPILPSVVRVFDITEQCFEFSKVVNWGTFPNCFFLNTSNGLLNTPEFYRVLLPSVIKRRFLLPAVVDVRVCKCVILKCG